jgi:hypothetical protein
LTWTPGTKPGEQTLTGAVRATDVTGTYTAELGGAPREPAQRVTSSRAIPIKKDKR